MSIYESIAQNVSSSKTNPEVPLEITELVSKELKQNGEKSNDNTYTQKSKLIDSNDNSSECIDNDTTELTEINISSNAEDINKVIVISINQSNPQDISAMINIDKVKFDEFINKQN